MKQFDRRLEIRRIAAKGFTQLAAISAKAIVLSQQLIKVLGEFCRPKWIERLCVSCFSLFLSTHFIENRCLFSYQKFQMIGKAVTVLAYNLESLWVVPLVRQLLYVLLDDFKRRRVLGERLLIEGRRQIFLQRMCSGQVDQSSEDFYAPLWRSNL